MKKIVTLGPIGTYSEIAASSFRKKIDEDTVILYEESMELCFKSDFDFLVVPIENSVDGYIQRNLDFIYLNDLFILDELSLDIDFNLVSFVSLLEIEKLFVQFKAKNQCLNFLSDYDFNYETTQSNTLSLSNLLSHKENAGAIIPSHLIEDYIFKTNIPHISDTLNNQTRFVLLSKKKIFKFNKELMKLKIAITPFKDTPGLLSRILIPFSDLKINLSSIMSRPSKKVLGDYIFFVDCIVSASSYSRLIYYLDSESDLSYKVLGLY